MSPALLVLLRLGARSLRLHKLRSSLSILGVVFGVAAVVAMSSVGEGARRETLAQIAALGPEDPNEPPGPNHRAGQPCVLCHSEGGPASATPFAVAGTIYETRALNSPGAEGSVVDFIDRGGTAPRRRPRTGASGNFFVLASDWPERVYPFSVRLLRADEEGTLQTVAKMKTTIKAVRVSGSAM